MFTNLPRVMSQSQLIINTPWIDLILQFFSQTICKNFSKIFHNRKTIDKLNIKPFNVITIFGFFTTEIYWLRYDFPLSLASIKFSILFKFINTSWHFMNLSLLFNWLTHAVRVHFYRYCRHRSPLAKVQCNCCCFVADLYFLQCKLYCKANLFFLWP